MACPRCALQLRRQTEKYVTSLPRRRTFHSTPRRNRLGAATYAQEWNTGTYHYNKALQKTLPVAQSHVDNLLTMYATQQKRTSDPSNPLARQQARSSIAAQRRQEERVFFSRPTAKDFGDRIKIQAFMYDSIGAKAREEAERRAKMKGVKPDGTTGGNGQRRRGPQRRGPGASAVRGTPGTGYRVPGRSGGVTGPGIASRVPGRAGGVARPGAAPRVPGRAVGVAGSGTGSRAPGAAGRGGGVGGMTAYRRVAGIGSGPVRRDDNAAGGRSQR